MEEFLDFKLCYVDDNSEYPGGDTILYFTELDDVTKQWGDDWDDVPYEHNAEPPYEHDYNQPEQGVKDGRGIYPRIRIYKVMITGGHNIMTPRSKQLNSPYTVEDINKGIVPWLTIMDKKDRAVYVKAGSTLRDTLEALSKSQDYIGVYFEATDEQYKKYLDREWRD